ncbi:MAG TPA: cupin, partial [Xanthomonadales bacterium]|nr:cupin [Xanthomonadales bacterium]
MIPTLLGGLTAEEFLANYWQKKPLLVRGAVPGFTGVSGVSGRNDMLALAARDDVESRFVSQADGWTLEHGPFNPSSLKRRPRPWTVLVQSVNL